MSENKFPELIEILEAVLLVAHEPITIKQCVAVWPDEEKPSEQQVKEALDKLMEKYQSHTVMGLQKLASGYTFQVKSTFAPWICRLWEEKPQKYSKALLETLAIIAYRQPITRGDIENIRGVAVSSPMIRTLLEHRFIRIVGHKEVPGRPALLATTPFFLDHFNLTSLDELPPLTALEDLDIAAQKLEGDLVEHSEDSQVSVTLAVEDENHRGKCNESLENNRPIDNQDEIVSQADEFSSVDAAQTIITNKGNSDETDINDLSDVDIAQ